MSLAVLGAPVWAQSQQPAPRVELRVAPAGEWAERIAARVRELLAAVGVQVSVSDVAEMATGTSTSTSTRTGTSTSTSTETSTRTSTSTSTSTGTTAGTVPLSDVPLAWVAIGAADGPRVQVRVDGAQGASTTREVVLEGGQLDEAACEEVATVVRSSVEALLAGQPLPGEVSEVPAAAAAPVVADPAPVTSPARAADAPARATPSTEPAGPRPELQARVGYEAALWGEGHVLHGPQVVVSQDWPLAWGRLGVRIEGFFAVPGRVESNGVDAELWATAVRLLAVTDLPIGRRFAAEAALGVSAQYTRLDGLSAPSDASPREASTHWGVAARLYGGARMRLGRRSRGLVALGLALELDPVQVQYGVQYADGFEVTHEPLPVRPSLVASGGMVF